jgi:hypothetical protein
MYKAVEECQIIDGGYTLNVCLSCETASKWRLAPNARTQEWQDDQVEKAGIGAEAVQGAPKIKVYSRGGLKRLALLFFFGRSV